MGGGAQTKTRTADGRAKSRLSEGPEDKDALGEPLGGAKSRGVADRGTDLSAPRAVYGGAEAAPRTQAHQARTVQILAPKNQSALINTSLDVRGAARLNPLSSPTNNPNKRSSLQSQPKQQTKTGSASEVVEGRFASKFAKGRKHKWAAGAGQAAQQNNTHKEFSP